MAAPLAVGAGASEGLDTLLNRILVEKEVGERSRHDQALEGLQSRGLDQQDDVRKSLAELRDVQMKGLQATQADAAGRAEARQKLLDDPNIPETTKIGLRVHAALPEGDKSFPYELITGLKPTAAKSLQNHFADLDITDNGVPKHLKNVPVNYNPEDGSLTFQGKKLDPTNVHGVTSPSMAAAGLQWDPTAGLIINKGTGTASTVKGPEGVIQPQLTASSRTMKEGATALAPHIADIQKQADVLDKEGLFGPVMSRVRDVANRVGTIDEFFDALHSDPNITNDERIGRFASSLSLLASGAARVHYGGRGGSNTEAYNRFKAMLSDSGTPALFKGHIGAVNDFMQGYANMGNVPGAAGPGAGGPDLYQQYLDRNKTKK